MPKNSICSDGKMKMSQMKKQLIKASYSIQFSKINSTCWEGHNWSISRWYWGWPKHTYGMLRTTQKVKPCRNKETVTKRSMRVTLNILCSCNKKKKKGGRRATDSKGTSGLEESELFIILPPSSWQGRLTKTDSHVCLEGPQWEESRRKKHKIPGSKGRRVS